MSRGGSVQVVHRVLLAVLGAAALALLSSGAARADDARGPRRAGPGGRDRTDAQWVPEFGPASASAIAAVVAGGGLVLARRRRR